MAVRQLWLNNRKRKEDLMWVGSFLVPGTFWAFLKAHDLSAVLAALPMGRPAFPA